LHSEANNLRTRIGSTESRFGKLEELANKDDDLTESAKAKVGQAKTDSEEVQKRMQKALESIKMIQNEIQSMKEISIQDLDLLGRFHSLSCFKMLQLQPSCPFRTKTQRNRSRT
jgi:methyl-accepting chemotaxis protein